MAWYTRYLSVFEQPFSEASESIVDEVKNKLDKFRDPVPLASVVVVAHNEETRLLSCLWSLSNNICRYPIEIIGINNNSTDRTADVFTAVGINSYFEEKKSAGYARRCGLENAKGKYYICIDSDTIYPPFYIQTLIDNLEKPNIVGVAALWSFIPDKEYPRISLFFYEFLRNIHIRIQYIKRPERVVRGMTFAHDTEFGRKVGYRVNLRRGEDGSMALGLKKYGKIKLIISTKARPVTATNTLAKDGSLWRSFVLRFVLFVKGVPSYFKKKKEFKDEASNLITEE